MTITPNEKLMKLKEDFNKASREEKKIIIEEIVKNRTYLNEYYNYTEGDIRKKAGYNIQAQLIDKALVLTPEEIISELTGISSDNLESIMKFQEEEYFFDCLDALIKLNEISEVRKMFNGGKDKIDDEEAKIGIGKIFREFRSKYPKRLDFEEIFPFSEKFLQKCEGVYFKKQCEESENCIYKEHFR